MKGFATQLGKIRIADIEKALVLSGESTELIDEINSAKTKIEEDYKKWFVIYTEYNKKAQTARRLLAETTQNQRLINMETLYGSTAKTFNTIQTQMTEFKNDNKSFVNKKLQDALYPTINTILRFARSMKKFHDQNKSKPVPSRILAVTTKASGQVVVSTSGVDLVRPQSAPAASSTTVDTKAIGGSSAGIHRIGSVLAILIVVFVTQF